MDDFRYFLSIVDDHSRVTWVMRYKSATRHLLQSFVTLVDTQFSTKVKIICFDNGLEFYASKGIIHQHSCIEIPQQYGIIERKHQHLLNVARALSFQEHLSQFWGDCVLTATYLMNQILSSYLHGKLPYEVLFS